MRSLDFRRFRRVLLRCSVLSFVKGLTSLVGDSEGVLRVLDSSLGGLEGFEEECLRWCVGDPIGRDELAIQPCKVQGVEEHDRHVHGPLRIASFRDNESMFTC